MPFNMIIVGMTACGKTHYLVQELKTTFFHQFENIFLICPTYHWNRTYDKDFIHEDDNFFVISCQQDEVEKYLKFVVDFAKGKESLVILDDCASTKSVKDRTGELVDLGFSARHMSISTIVITQKLTSIAKTIPTKYFEIGNILYSEQTGHEDYFGRISFCRQRGNEIYQREAEGKQIRAS